MSKSKEVAPTSSSTFIIIVMFAGVRRLCSCRADTSQGSGQLCRDHHTLCTYISLGELCLNEIIFQPGNPSMPLVLASWEVAHAHSRHVNEPDLVSRQRRGVSWARKGESPTVWPQQDGNRESEWNVSSPFLWQWLHCSAMRLILCSQCPLGQLSVDTAL